MAQLFRALEAFAEDLGSVLSTTICNSSSRSGTPFLASLDTKHPCAQVDMQAKYPYIAK